ncbi:hypothetical protein [Streptomyces sp. KAU_LT]|uniref:hypothetical protein n=1 Tax=Streptomyces sp. KAU_LT TaxID=3046669 RepID=UPI0024B63A54|nr:hypothetical protein [Streptomyces sp. KAU_LT]MDI9835458.1 hypothetical protein [Streptomyces sp. KAU_LT]
MTARTAKKETLHVPRTGWLESRHPEQRAIRTCVAAVEDRSTPSSARTGAEGNIVRGED